MTNHPSIHPSIMWSSTKHPLLISFELCLCELNDDGVIYESKDERENDNDDGEHAMHCKPPLLIERVEMSHQKNIVFELDGLMGS